MTSMLDFLFVKDNYKQITAFFIYIFHHVPTLLELGLYFPFDGEKNPENDQRVRFCDVSYCFLD